MRFSSRLFAFFVGGLLSGLVSLWVHWRAAAAHCPAPPGTCVIPLERFVLLAPLLILAGGVAGLAMEELRHRWVHRGMRH